MYKWLSNILLHHLASCFLILKVGDCLFSTISLTVGGSLCVLTNVKILGQARLVILTLFINVGKFGCFRSLLIIAANPSVGFLGKISALDSCILYIVVYSSGRFLFSALPVF